MVVLHLGLVKLLSLLQDLLELLLLLLLDFSLLALLLGLVNFAGDLELLHHELLGITLLGLFEVDHLELTASGS